MEKTVRLRTRDGLTLDVSIPARMQRFSRMMHRRSVYGKPMSELPYYDDDQLIRNYIATGLFIPIGDTTIEIFEEE